MELDTHEVTTRGVEFCVDKDWLSPPIFLDGLTRSAAELSTDWREEKAA